MVKVRISHLLASIFLMGSALAGEPPTQPVAQRNTDRHTFNTSRARTNRKLKTLLVRYKAASPHERQQIAKHIAAAVEDDVNQLIALLRSPDSNEREAGAKAACVLGPKAAPLIAVLAEALKQNDTGRTEIADALAAIGRASVPFAAEFLESDEYGIWRAGLRIAMKLGDDAVPVIPKLLDLLSADGRDYDHSDFAGALIAIGEPAIIPLCQLVEKGISAANSESAYRASLRAALVLGKFESGVDAAAPCLLRSLEEGDSKQKLEFAEALIQLGQGSEKVAVVLAAVVNGDDEDLSRQAALKLAKLGALASPYFERALLDQRQRVRLDVVAALSNLGDEQEKVRLLRMAARNDDSWIRFKATATLAYLTPLDDESVANLLIVFQNDDAHAREQAVFLVRRLNPLGLNAEAVLERALSDGDRNVRLAALRVISEKRFNTDALLIRLLSLMNSDDREFQLLLHQSFASAGGRSVAPLKSLLTSKEPLVRYNAVSVCGNLGVLAESLIPEIVILLDDVDYDISSKAAATLKKIGKPALDALISQLLGTRGTTRTITRLQVLGEWAAPAAEPLADLAARAPEPEVRTAALKVLAALGPNAARVIPRLREVWERAGHVERRELASTFSSILQERAARTPRQWLLRELLINIDDVEIAKGLLRSIDAGEGEAAEVIRKIATGELTNDLALRLVAIEIIGRSRPSMLTPELFRQLVRSDSIEISVAAINTLPAAAGYDTDRLWKEAERSGLFDDPKVRVRVALLDALRNSPEPSFSKFVRVAISDENDGVRASALWAVAGTALWGNQKNAKPSFWEPELVKRLRQVAKEDRMEENRQLAIRLLAAHDSNKRDVLNTLTLALKDPSRVVVIEAITALGAMGYEAVPVLRDFLYSATIERPQDYELMAFARNALDRARMVVYDAPPPYYGFNTSYPRMEWPPARFTDRLVFEKVLLGQFRTTLGDYFARVESATRDSGYPQPSVYAIPGGFAIATLPERISADGEPYPDPARWTLGKLPLSFGEILKYPRRLFLGSTERFRWLVFYATNRDFGSRDVNLSLTEARNWASRGFAELPGSVSAEPAINYSCGVLVFEFMLPDGDQEVRLMTAPSIPALQQLRATGLYQKIFR